MKASVTDNHVPTPIAYFKSFRPLCGMDCRVYTQNLVVCPPKYNRITYFGIRMTQPTFENSQDFFTSSPSTSSLYFLDYLIQPPNLFFLYIWLRTVLRLQFLIFSTRK